MKLNFSTEKLLALKKQTVLKIPDENEVLPKLGLRCSQETYVDPEMLIPKKYGYKNVTFSSKQRVLRLLRHVKANGIQQLKNRRRSNEHVLKINIIISMEINIL